MLRPIIHLKDDSYPEFNMKNYDLTVDKLARYQVSYQLSAPIFSAVEVTFNSNNWNKYLIGF